MNYPIRILPNINYKSISCDLSRHYLVRFTPHKDILDQGTGLIKQEFVCNQREHAADLSVSLLGVFEIEHIKIELTEIGKSKYGTYCTPDETVEVPIFEQDFKRNDDRHFWAVLVENIMESKIDYTGSEDPFTAECVIEHSPMKWNFWHFSIRWKIEDGYWHEFPDGKKRKVAKRIGHDVRATIAKFAQISEPYYEELDKAHYTK